MSCRYTGWGLWGTSSFVSLAASVYAFSDRLGETSRQGSRPRRSPHASYADPAFSANPHSLPEELECVPRALASQKLSSASTPAEARKSQRFEPPCAGLVAAVLAGLGARVTCTDGTSDRPSPS